MRAPALHKEQNIENNKDADVEDGVDGHCFISVIYICFLDLDEMSDMTNSLEESIDLMN